jgi:hypothetical protein
LITKRISRAPALRCLLNGTFLSLEGKKSLLPKGPRLPRPFRVYPTWPGALGTHCVIGTSGRSSQRLDNEAQETKVFLLLFLQKKKILPYKLDGS